MRLRGGILEGEDLVVHLLTGVYQIMGVKGLEDGEHGEVSSANTLLNQRTLVDVVAVLKLSDSLSGALAIV